MGAPLPLPTRLVNGNAARDGYFIAYRDSPYPA